MALQSRQAETFGNNALTCKSRVAMDEQRQHGAAFLRVAAILVLLGADLPEHHRIDDLEMRGICGQR